MRSFLLLATLLLLSLTACSERGRTLKDLPTPITDLNAYATAQVMTQNAPPERFRDSIHYPRLDDGLNDVSGWRGVVALDFDGVFVGTSRPARGHVSAEIFYNESATARRVLLNTEGELLTAGKAARLEAVRIGRDTYQVSERACAVTTDSPSAGVADLGVGALIGGVREARPTGEKQRINDVDVWRYAFLQDALDVSPSVQALDGARVTVLSGELWFSPEYEAVVRFYLTLDVENARVLGSQVPVTGLVIIRYDLFDIGIAPNISVPFGC